MATVNNPYSDLLSIMASQGAINNPPGLKLGTVKSIEPLVVAIDGLELNESFVKVSQSLKPHKRECKLDGKFNIKLDTTYTPQISNYTMPNKTIGLTATSKASVTNNNPESVSVSVSTSINNDSHTHGTHNHTSSSLSSVIGKGKFEGSVEYTDWLIQKGDIVVVLSSNDKQSYVVIAKI